jgi:hypothetical protein
MLKVIDNSCKPHVCGVIETEASYSTFRNELRGQDEKKESIEYSVEKF